MYSAQLMSFFLLLLALFGLGYAENEILDLDMQKSHLDEMKEILDFG